MTSTSKFIDALWSHAENNPEKPALHFLSGGQADVIPYRELAHRADRYAAFYADNNLEAGSVVFIVLPHRAELYDAFIGAMMAGLVPSFLPFATPKQDPVKYWDAHQTLFARVTPSMIVTYADNVDAIKGALPQGSSTKVVAVETLEFPEHHTAPRPAYSQDRVALLQHSSGTTGLKKGVMLTHGQVRDQIESYAASFQFDDTCTVASWLPLYHDMGLFSSFLMPIMVGATVVVMDPFEWVAKPIMLLDAVSTYQATHCWMPNFAFSHICRYVDMTASDVPDLSGLRAAISCSEPVRADSVSQFRAYFAPHGLAPTAPQACYAMAETVFAVSQSDHRAEPRVICIDTEALKEPNQPVVKVAQGAGMPFVSNGAPIDGISVRIATAQGPVDVKPGASSANAGEIEVKGRFVFDGYYRNPDQTKAAFTQDGWYKTGDIGFADEGELFICGRTKELLIIHGKNFYVGDIEQIVSAIDGVKPGRVVAFDVFDNHTDSDECVVMAETEITDPKDARALKREIKAQVAKGLSLQIKTVDLVAIGTLAKTTSGKMSRAENKKIWEARL